ncbi:hypothetical protein MUN89_05945 [Halobacillus salinarum]|uniref:Uncharacterized protein n=1 Tax=Halobacillus salinarum TaxID=2932257 RepID=A0ABY4EM10_9BACI|nr:hypothetical protein [Halobacillus salinarum]UOQ45486.1 hypothetical protein MUN89_05945 [Halobacillus salinarum]
MKKKIAALVFTGLLCVSAASTVSANDFKTGKAGYDLSCNLWNANHEDKICVGDDKSWWENLFGI